MLPVVIGVKGKMINLTPLPDSQPAGFLFRKATSPFLKTDLMKFLFCIHKIILLDRVTRFVQIERIARNHV
ncbi:hypothetical protein DW725_12610 [Clostridiaceae bacterium AM27-36LB]|nr:hypothetical protein DW725_12610 [Clostridiaceae bacterium AM27-36LB]